MKTKKGFLYSLCFGAALACFLLTRGLAVEIIPATMQDIMKALGPDAKGLSLNQESLPDLFALTASRIEENAKQFIVEEPYVDGRWKGGKAVIEYARDLSYTLVSVYDKQGHRERIYSVRTNFTEQIAHEKASAQGQAQAEPAAENVAQETQTSPPAPPPTPSRETAASPKRIPPTSTVMGAGANAGYEWNEALGSYVPMAPANSAPAAEAEKTTAGVPAASEKETAAPTTPAVHHRKHHHEEKAVASARVTPTPASTDGVWIPAKAASSDSSLVKVKVADTTWVEKRPDKPAVEHPHHKRRHKPAEPKAATPPETQTVVSSKMSAKPSSPAETKANEEWVPKSIQQPTKEATPIDIDHMAAPVAAAPKPEPAKEAPPAPVSPPPAPVTHAVSAPAQEQDAVPSTEELLTSEQSKGPDTSESDKWVPKAVTKPAVAEPEVPQEPVKVAMVPKPAPVDNSVDNMLKMASQEKSEMPHESDSWVPKKTVAPKPDVEINQELARIRAEEKKKAASKPVVQERHDINNPEEGVLPVSSFEKFSGPMYGRHREYERRFFPGKKAKSKAPDHDFYVEEIDRKKEIHNIYFYQHLKGKAPKLVAVERHERVSFLENYDIEKEDKGKISTY